MVRHLARSIGLLVMLTILGSGPVVACVCPDQSPGMPCCPDDDSGTDHTGYAKTDTGFYSACDPVSTDLLAAEIPRLPAVGNFEAPRPPSLSPLPTARVSVEPQRYVARPIYLLTERRRE